MSAQYRVRQFLLAAGASLRRERLPDPAVSSILPPAGVELFQRMPAYDRRHALGVLRTLQKQGREDPDLLAAALLHDVGKTVSEAGRLRLWHRVAMVLLGALRPGLIDRIGRATPSEDPPTHEGWRRAFFVQAQHAEIGAESALRAGCSGATAELIRCHETPCIPVQDPRLAALRAADAAN
jgi:hypothetical protein